MKEQNIDQAKQFYEREDEAIFKYMTSDLRIAAGNLRTRIREDLDKIYVEQVRKMKGTA